MRKWANKFSYSDDSRPFLEHLDDLRAMLVRCVVSIFVGVLVCIPLTTTILDLLREPLPPDIVLNSTDIIAPFLVMVKIAIWSGIILSAPFIFYFVGIFAAPGIKKNEQTWILRFVIAGGVLFIVGVGLGYSVTLPMALKVMLHFHKMAVVENIWIINNYISFSLRLLLGFGVAFELPVILLMLGKFGIINSSQLRKYRRHVIVGVFVLAMLLTPPEIMSQLMMALPLIILYECCIWITWVSEKRKKKSDSDATEEPEETLETGDADRDENKE